MAEESANQFLRRRQSELKAKAAALNGQLRPIEAELADIEKMLSVAAPPAPPPPFVISDRLDGVLQATLNPFEGLDKQLKGAIDSFAESMSVGPEAVERLRQSVEALLPSKEALVALRRALITSTRGDAQTAIETDFSKYERMTIKELVIQALIDHFPNGGRISEIHKFMKDGYGRDVEPASLRPQMHRLKADEVLFQVGDVWNLNTTRRQLYMKYDHPTSRAHMRELQDETPESRARRTLAGSAGYVIDED